MSVSVYLILFPVYFTFGKLAVLLRNGIVTITITNISMGHTIKRVTSYCIELKSNVTLLVESPVFYLFIHHLLYTCIIFLFILLCLKFRQKGMTEDLTFFDTFELWLQS